MTHTDGLIERPPRIASADYLFYAIRHRRIGIDRADSWWVIDCRAAEPTYTPHHTFAAAWEHADRLTKAEP